MNTQDLRDIVAQIIAAHPTENSNFLLLLEGKNGFLQITFMSHDNIKIQIQKWCGYEEDWVALAPFQQLSDIAWDLSERYKDESLVFIQPGNHPRNYGKLVVTHEEVQVSIRKILGKIKIEEADLESCFGDTLEWLEDIHFQVACLVENFYEFSTKLQNAWNPLVWKANYLLEQLELLFFNEEEFEVYGECGVNGYDWFHFQAAALIARQNTVGRKPKNLALSGINVSALNNNLEISAMCPNSTTYRLIWQDEEYWQNFSFTVPVELIDKITQSVDVSAIDTVVFFVNPDLIRVKVSYKGRVVDNGMAAMTHLAYFLVKPIEGRYWYPKVPINQVTERSVLVKKELLLEAFLGATKGTFKAQDDEVLLQIQDEKLYLHGMEGSFEIYTVSCSGIPDNQIRLSCNHMVNLLNYTDSGVLFLAFPDKITQALMLGNCSGIQYLIFGLIKGDYVLTPEDPTQQLLVIPGIIPGEPDLVLELAEHLILEPPLPEAEALHIESQLLRSYGYRDDWAFDAAVDQMCDRFVEAEHILADRSPCPAINSLVDQLQAILDEYEYAIAAYKAGDPNGELSQTEVGMDIEHVYEVTTSVKILAGRIEEYSSKVQKTYSVRMTFA